MIALMKRLELLNKRDTCNLDLGPLRIEQAQRLVLDFSGNKTEPI